MKGEGGFVMLMAVIFGLICIFMFCLFVVCLRAYWYFFRQTEHHRWNLEKMIVELVLRLPLEESRRGPNDYGLQVLLWNCHFRRYGRAYNESYRHGQLPFFKEWLVKGLKLDFYPCSDYGRRGLFLDDEMFSKNDDGYIEFLETLGYDVKELERD